MVSLIKYIHDFKASEIIILSINILFKNIYIYFIYYLGNMNFYFFPLLQVRRKLFIELYLWLARSGKCDMFAWSYSITFYFMGGPLLWSLVFVLWINSMVRQFIYYSLIFFLYGIILILKNSQSNLIKHINPVNRLYFRLLRPIKEEVYIRISRKRQRAWKC